MTTCLSEQMRAYAADRPSIVRDFIAKADAFDEAAAGFYAQPQTHNAAQFLGAYARARKAWCEATGEPLV